MAGATTYETLGSVEPGDFKVDTVPKVSGAITAGQILARMNTVTPNAWGPATSASLRPFRVASKDAASDATYVESYDRGRVRVKAAGAIQPGAYVMPDDNGDVVVYANALDNKCGKYLWKPGEDGAIAKSAAADNDTIIIELNEV